jgi:hypothetical protein
VGKKSTPAPPDYEAAAEKTAAGNLENLHEQTRANRPDMYTPFGASEWVQDGQGNWVNRVSLDPMSQESLDTQQALGLGRTYLAGDMLGNVGETMGTPMDWSQFGDYTRDLSTGAEARQGAEDALYGRATSRLDPRWEEKNMQAEAKLRSQGLRPGDEAYDRFMAEQGRQETDAYNQAMYSSILAGGQEASREQGMDLTAGTFGNQVRDAEVADQIRERGFSLNELNALLSGQQVGLPGFQNFSQAGVTQGADYLSAANMGYQADLDAYSAKNAAINGMMQGATGFFGV